MTVGPFKPCLCRDFLLNDVINDVNREGACTKFHSSYWSVLFTTISHMTTVYLTLNGNLGHMTLQFSI